MSSSDSRPVPRIGRRALVGAAGAAALGVLLNRLPEASAADSYSDSLQRLESENVNDVDAVRTRLLADLRACGKFEEALALADSQLRALQTFCGAKRLKSCSPAFFTAQRALLRSINPAVVEPSIGPRTALAECETPVFNVVCRAYQELRLRWLAAKGVTPPAGYVLVPAGFFECGTPSAQIDRLIDWIAANSVTTIDKREWLRECPHREVLVGDFFVAQRPATNRELKEFYDASHGSWKPVYREAIEAFVSGLEPLAGQDLLYFQEFMWDAKSRAAPPGQEDYVAWFLSAGMALAYARSRGGRIPTDAEWEKAGRGLDSRSYPYGVVGRDDLHWNRLNAEFPEVEPGQRKVWLLAKGGRASYDLSLDSACVSPWGVRHLGIFPEVVAARLTGYRSGDIGEGAVERPLPSAHRWRATSGWSGLRGVTGRISQRRSEPRPFDPAWLDPDHLENREIRRRLHSTGVRVVIDVAT